MVKGKETVDSVVSNLESDVYDRLKRDLQLAGYKMDFPNEIIILAFKVEQKLQVYGKNSDDVRLIKEYPFTAYSGDLGPKLKEGDRQIPEGVYKIAYLNPNSSYHLSLKVDYPNSFDKSKTSFNDISKMGGDIFIHGKAVTIGCIPIGDEAIEEVFLLAKKAYNNPIQVIISPWDFREKPYYPSIDAVEWEDELYDMIKKELLSFPKQ